MATRRFSLHRVVVFRAPLLTVLALAVLIGFTLAVFSEGLTSGLLYYGRDTAVFYYPLTEWAAGELRSGRLPLWLPLIFGGYPILADGEIGLLSPIHVPLLLAFPTPLAYSIERALHFGLAAVGLYLLARSLGAGRLGSVIGGLGFSYGSFMVGHLQHDNILRSAAWLPWLLLVAEHALRTRGSRRLGWAVLGALVLAVQALGVHIQPVLLSLLALGLYLLFGPLGRASIAPGVRPGVSRAAALGRTIYRAREGLARSLSAASVGGLRGWAVGRVGLGAIVVALGLGLAAAQLIPLYDFGQHSLRPSLVTYDYATSYAVMPPQVLTLIFPRMFNFDQERHWAFWSPAETTLYYGIAPLLLAIIALLFVRGRAVAFFAILGLVSLILVFGDYLPIKAYIVIWSLPGFAYLRAPARFGLLLGLSIAVLAAFGMTWFTARARHPAAPRVLRSVLSGMLLAPFVLAILLGALRWWLRFEPLQATQLITPLLAGPSKENAQLGAWHVYYGLLEFTRPDNLRTGLALGLLIAVPGLLRLWLARPRFEVLWSALMIVLVVGDLWVFATEFFPRTTPEHLTASTAIVDQLPAEPSTSRVFVEPSLNAEDGANMLVRHDLATVNGYSSLEPPRFTDYFWSLVMQDNFLLDLFNVRYVLTPRRVTDLRTFEGANYHPSDRLLSGVAGNPSGSEDFRVPATPAATQVDALVVIGAVEGMGEVPSGTPVADVTLRADDGTSQTVQIRAGVDVAEYLAPEPGWPTAEYVGPRVVWAGAAFRPNRTGPPVRLYGSTIAVGSQVETTSIRVQVVIPTGRFQLVGLGLRGSDASVRSLRPSDNAKYRILDRGSTALLLENTTAWPRVSIVSGAMPAPAGGATADGLIERPWDPTRAVIVEGLAPADIRAPSASGPVGEARILSYEPNRVVVEANLTSPGYLVFADRYDDGWHAYVDGAAATVARADEIQRAVSLPAGPHEVTFVYDPLPFKIGLGVSAAAAIGLVLVLLLATSRALGGWRGRRRVA
ncbi:MAG: YfhO family protein [Chloroflexi bacterium]|nr:YfhO family protein [Chloroflexota bacterium]